MNLKREDIKSFAQLAELVAPEGIEVWYGFHTIHRCLIIHTYGYEFRENGYNYEQLLTWAFNKITKG